MEKDYGGIKVRILEPIMMSFQADKEEILGQDPYYYAIIQLSSGENFNLEKQMRYCIYILEDGGGFVLVNSIPAKKDQFLLGNSDSLRINCIQGQSIVLIAGQEDYQNQDPLKITHIDSAEVKRVEKPWGYEAWLTGEPTKVFAFKKIYLKSGNKTSLQYHKLKRETNFVISGVAELHYNPNISALPESVSSGSVDKIRITGPTVIDVFPNHVHRLEAIEDLMIYEISTPELDDVVRIADDTGRGHGRVEAEHIFQRDN